MSVRHPHTKKSALALAAILAVGAGPLDQAQAAACSFNPASGNWNVAGNWSCGNVPGAADTAVIAGGKTSTMPGGSFLGPTNLDNAGTLALSDNSGLALLGSNQNNGSITFGSVGNFTQLSISGAVSLSGSGTLSTSNNSNNRVAAFNGAGDVFTLGAGQSFLGAGSMGAGTALALVNHGNIVANLSTGITLNAQGGVNNNGVLRGDGAVLLIQNSNLTQGTSATLNAINNGVVRLQGSSISGGTFSSSSGGAIATAAGSFSNSVAGVTNTGQLTIVDNSGLSLAGTLTNNGNISLGSLGNFTELRVNGTQMLDGSGTLTLSNNSNNRILGNNATFTLGGGQTLSGAGTIGAGSANFVFNNAGTVIATQSSGLLINALGGVNNTGTLRADGGTLRLQTTINSAGGQIEARNGSRVELLGGSVINNAAFSATGAGSLITTVSGATVNMGGGTVNGPMTMADNSSLRLTANAIYNGVLSMASVGNFTQLLVDGVRTIGGAGTIDMSNNVHNRVVSANASGDVLTTAAGFTLQGAGSIGAGTGLGLTNNGSIVATQSSGITLQTSGVVNNNLLMRGDGAAFTVNGTTVNQGAAGVLSAINGGSVRLTGNSLITGGSLATASGGVVTTVSGGTARLSGVSNTGALNIVDNSSMVLDGTLTNNGSLNMGSLGNFTQLLVSGNVTLGGSGVTNLSNNTHNRILAHGAADQLSNGSGHTIQGSGTFGGGTTLNIVNAGTITANQSTALNVLVGAGHTVQNQAGALMQATAGGTLNLGNGLLNSGTLAANGGAVNASAGFTGTGTASTSGAGVLTLGAASTAGNLTNNGSSANALNLGAHNITLSSDYTNANFGVGNSFNRRANVSGAGQILAGGNVAQVINGAQVSNGSTNNATLTIGNVRLGNTTFNYQVGNAGSAGPRLRGALQTSVNGANLSDARLSGSGVTAANYNAGTPGGSSGNLGVVFNAASPGLLAPMSGQVLNLRSNFDNIADQKLNIVVGAGAAAFNPAAGLAVSPVTLANQRVGGGNFATLLISNTAPAGSFSEDLNVQVNSASGAAAGAGFINGRVAGSNNTGSGSITVGVNAASAGAKSGNVSLAYSTAGSVAGVSNGLGTAGVGGQSVAVSGNVYQPAAGQLLSAPLNFGTVQVGQLVSQNLQVRNSASGAAGFVEDLSVSFGAKSGSGSALFDGTGSFSGITAGSTSNAGNGVMTVSVNTAAAGSVNGSIAINYTSAGAVGGVSNGLGTLAVGSDNFGVAGTIQAQVNVINQASPLLNNPAINLGAVRVGAAAPTALVSISNQATVSPQAALNASISSNGAPFTASGSFNLLAPGSTSTVLQVGLNTGLAGNHSGSATLSLVSDAANVGNCAPNCQMNLAPQTVSVSGKVYTPAVGVSTTPLVDFGVVRVGDTVSARNISVSNTAAVTALGDTLRASVAGLSGPFTPGAAVANVAAQGNGQISVALNTSNAGVFGQTGSVTFTSQNPDMADTSAGANAAVQVQAQVNHLANADFDLLAGLGQLSDLGNGTYVLNLGQLALGSSGHWSLQIDNEVAGPADGLRGSFDLGAADDFALGGFGSVGDLAAGQAQAGLEVDFSATQLGSFEDEVRFSGFSFNASDPTGLAQGRRLLIRATVFDPNGGGTVPEPGTLALLLLAALAAVKTGARRHPRSGSGLAPRAT